MTNLSFFQSEVELRDKLLKAVFTWLYEKVAFVFMASLITLRLKIVLIHCTSQVHNVNFLLCTTSVQLCVRSAHSKRLTTIVRYVL